MAPGDGSVCMVDRSPVVESPGGGHWIATSAGGDDRDVFISWLRGEFAAANAIIDALCHHLQFAAGSPGEYDFVLGAIQQRRYNWNPVLHMQQYYSIADVLFALQQASFRKHAPVVMSGGDGTLVEITSDIKPIKPGLKGGSCDKAVGDAAGKASRKKSSSGSNGNSSSKDSEEASIASDTSSEHKTEVVSSSNGSAAKRSPPDAKKPSSSITEERSVPNGTEANDTQKVNVLEGLRVHDAVFDAKEASNLAALARDSHAAKKKTKTEAGGKRPSKANGKEVIHFGTIPSEISSPAVTEETAEPMPAFLESIIDRLVKSQVVPASKRPDSCSISVLEPGDYMPPHKHNNFEQPLFILSLGSKSELEFGRELKANHATEDAAEKCKVVLPVGSVLVLEGNSAQMVQCAVPPLQSTRMLITFGKMANKTLKAKIGSPKSPVGSSSSPLSPAAAIEAFHHKQGPGFVHVIPATRSHQVTPAPMVVPVRSSGQILQAQQPVLIASVGPYSPVTMVGPGWSTPPPGATRVPSPGTGVFLPAGNGNRSKSGHHFDATSNGHCHQKAIAA